MLVESPVVCFGHPGCVYRAVESDDSVDATVRAERGLSDVLTVSPLLDGVRGKLAKAVKADRGLACEQLPPMH
jgi:hypothetical protein